MSAVWTSERGAIHHAKAEDVYPDLQPGSVSLVISDGPYGMGKAGWDKQKTDDDLREWYRPHVEAWGRVCADSATVYVWGTDDSASALRPLMREHGWARKTRITWDKGLGSIAGKFNTAAARTWAELTEVCDMYQRCAIESESPTGPGTMAAHAAGADERNWIRVWLAAEWKATGLGLAGARSALGCAPGSGLPSHYFSRSQWMLPTWENFQRLAAYAAEHAAPRARPYLVHPDVIPRDLRATYDHLRAEYDHLRAEYDHLRAEYEAKRVPFSHPTGIGNVWRHNQVSGGERLRGLDGKALHPCQKPLAFSDRIIRASSRPGDLVLEPFGGTCRVAFACEALMPDEARRYVCIEPDLDGRDYLGAVVRLLDEQAATPTLFDAVAK